MKMSQLVTAKDLLEMKTKLDAMTPLHLFHDMRQDI